MSTHLADTHTLVWHFTDPSRLSSRVAAVLEEAESAQGRILVPSIVVVELVYLAERPRVPEQALRRTLELLGRPRGSYRCVPLDLAIARALERIGRSEVPDLPDRIIAATAMVLQVPLLSKDPQLKALKTIRTLW